MKSPLREFRQEETQEVTPVSGHCKSFHEGSHVARAVWMVGERTVGCTVSGWGWEGRACHVSGLRMDRALF